MGKAIIIPGVSFASFGIGRVTIGTPVPVESISIVPVPGGVVGSHQMELTYYPVNAQIPTIVWSITSGTEYATINPSTGLLTALSGANNNNVTVRAEVSGSPSIYDTETVAVTASQPQPISEWYVDNLDQVAAANATDTNWFPVMCAHVAALNNVPVNKFKFACAVTGEYPTVTLSIYSFDNVNDPVEIEEVGTFPVTLDNGVALINFPTDKTLSTNQIVGIKAMSGCGIRYTETPVGTPIDGGWAYAAFSGTLFIGIGYDD